MNGMHARLLVVLVATAAVIGGSFFLAAPYLSGTTDGQADEPVAGPLVPEPLLPRSEDAIDWFEVQGRLGLARDHPELTALLLDLLRGPVEYVRFKRDNEMLAPPSSGCFAVGLEGGSVLLADFLRVMHDRSAIARLRPQLLKLDPQGLDNRSSVLSVTPSEELRLKPGTWRLLACKGAAKGPLPRAEREKIDAYLAQVAGIMMHRRDWVLKETPDIHGPRIQAAWHVAFAAPPELRLVPVDDWQPFYYLDRPGDIMAAAPLRSVPGRTQAHMVQPVRRLVDEAIIMLREGYADGTAHVYLRLADTKQWINAGIVPLKYP